MAMHPLVPKTPSVDALKSMPLVSRRSSYFIFVYALKYESMDVCFALRTLVRVGGVGGSIGA
jgi:hypothetical protein